MSWLLFAIIPYALFSVTNFIEKFLIEKKIRYPSAIIILGGLLTLLLGFIILAFRDFHALPISQVLLLVTSGIFTIFYLIPYFKALSLDDASRVAPLFQFFPVFVLIISYFFLHERLTMPELVGFGFVTAGGFLLGAERIDKRFFRLKKSLWYMLLASFLYSLTGILFKYVTVTDFWLNMSYQSIGVGIGACLLFFHSTYRHNFSYEIKKMQRSTFSVILLNISFGTLADFTNFYAITLAPVALVSSMQGTQPVFLLLFGLILTRWFPKIIKEDISRKTIILKIVSMILLGVGIYFIYI